MPKERHFVSVIELDKDVLYESKFKKANPDYLAGKPCVYVGMTGRGQVKFESRLWSRTF